MKNINDIVLQISDNISSLTKRIKYLETQSSIKTIVRTENGNPEGGINGQICINKFDNTAKIYVNGVWKEIAEVTAEDQEIISNETIYTIGALIDSAMTDTPADDDFLPYEDKTPDKVLKKMSLSNFKILLKAYFDALYVDISELSSINAHINNTNNPHSVTKAQVGLGSANNTSDLDKPVSTATQTALNLKANLASPTLTGDPKAPTPAVGDNDTSIATTAFVNAEISNDRPYSDTNPVMNGTATQGVSINVSRQDHVHPSDATKVTGPESATDNAIARFDGTTGKLVQNSLVTINDSGGLSAVSGNFTGAVDIGQDLAVGTNVLFVDQSQANIGINCAPDDQFALDVNGAARASYFVGPHAIQLADASMICHFDGGTPYETNYTGELNGHMGQIGTATGGVIFRPGKFGKGVQVAEATTNLVVNPSFEVSSSGWTAINGAVTRLTTDGVYGSCCLKIDKNTGTTGGGYTSVTTAVSGSYTAQLRYKAVSGSVGTAMDFWLRFNYSDSALTESAYINLVTSDNWQIATVTATTDSAKSLTSIGLYVSDRSGGGAKSILIDAVQLEQKAYATPYCDGSLGSGHVWNGTSDASSSTRTGATLTYPISVIDYSEGSVSCWINQSAVKLSSQGVFFAGSGNSQLDAVLFSGGYINFRMAGVNFYTTPIITSANQWYHLVFTWSSSQNTRSVFVNGSLFASRQYDTGATLGTALRAFWGASSDQALNGVGDDFVVLKQALTAIEVRAIYESNAPVFAETSKFTFRSAKSGLVWGDEEGLWMRNSAGNSAFGVSGVDAKSWGGLTLDSGDLLIGSSTKYVKWDSSATTLEIAGKVTALSGFIGNGSTGFTIGNTAISNGKSTLTDANVGIYLGTDGIALGASSVFKVTSSGNLTATSATITGTINANTGYLSNLDVTGKLTMSGANSAIAIGTTPPTSATVGTGIWLDRTGLYGLAQVPTALTAGTPTSGGAVTAGTHSYKVTFVTSAGETSPSVASNIITAVATSGQTVPLTAIPLGFAGVTARKIYRTIAGDTGNYKLLTTIANNTVTTYSDTIADASLGADAPTTNLQNFKLDAVTGQATLAGALITGPTLISSTTGYLSIGATPPTSSTAGTGLWLDRTGYYGLSSGTYQVKIDATNGKLYAGGGNVVLDSSGIIVTPGTEFYEPSKAYRFNNPHGGGEEWGLFCRTTAHPSVDRAWMDLSLSRGAYKSGTETYYVNDTAGDELASTMIYASSGLIHASVEVNLTEAYIYSSFSPIKFVTKDTRGYLYVPIEQAVWSAVANKANGSTVDVNSYNVPTEAVAISMRLAYKSATVGDYGFLSYSGYVNSMVARVQAANQYGEINGIMNLPSDGVLTFNTNNGTNTVTFIIGGYFI